MAKFSSSRVYGNFIVDSDLNISGTLKIPTGNIIGLSSSNITDALGYTPYNATNPSNYISDYTVTEADVTAHQGALSITESQISDLGPYDNYSSWTFRALNSSGGVLGSSGITTGDIASLKAGSNISLSWADDQITINSTIPEAPTATLGSTSYGTQGTAQYRKSGTTLYIKLD